MKKIDYEMVIGLEVHVELATQSKIFCGCSTAYGAEPNTQCCPVCMGMPGTLPVLNRKVVDYAVRAGLALGCDIARYSKQDRKNYFYPDLPKAYQISQYDLPLCQGGCVKIVTEAGEKDIRLTRIHIEEDAGKLVHDARGTLIDCNRCGVPLIEIVSEPDLRSAEEADAYLKKLRSVLRYTGVSECRMDRGQMRADVNLSVRRRGSDALGTRTEMKNLNSFQFIGRAIEEEFARQVQVLEEGGQVVQETRRFDPATGKTSPLRSKEDASDYRYFPDPDLPPIRIGEDFLEKRQAEIPPLPDVRRERYVREYGLSAYEAERLTAEKAVADYFERAAALCADPGVLASLLLREVFRKLDAGQAEIPVSPARLAAVADLISAGRINHGTARQLVEELWTADFDPAAAVRDRGLAQITDRAVLLGFARDALRENPPMLADYRRGKMAAAGALMGRAMALSGGKAAPRQLSAILTELLATDGGGEVRRGQILTVHGAHLDP